MLHDDGDDALLSSAYRCNIIDCNTMCAMIRERYCFIKNTVCESNVVLRTVCSLYFNEIQRLIFDIDLHLYLIKICIVVVVVVMA